jgi:hypothetical protein
MTSVAQSQGAASFGRSRSCNAMRLRLLRQWYFAWLGIEKLLKMQQFITHSVHILKLPFPPLSLLECNKEKEDATSLYYLQCCGSETFCYGSGSDFSKSYESGSDFSKGLDPTPNRTRTRIRNLELWIHNTEYLYGLHPPHPSIPPIDILETRLTYPILNVVPVYASNLELAVVVKMSIVQGMTWGGGDCRLDARSLVALSTRPRKDVQLIFKHGLYYICLCFYHYNHESLRCPPPPLPSDVSWPLVQNSHVPLLLLKGGREREGKECSDVKFTDNARLRGN